ncbi:50S ribosomal protein L25 [Acidaminobacter sp. JC074]|uniref:50S ribosomal protein L25 n=1 Tax=Acidaminobacter sp. JC074 TaxID=2530199 RepID=UPI001F0DA90C|nr:50S ribosomal protein L25 [Acidaminobacter sp. JC074]MCH4886727.1 50S ribosomal protein L25 [Acidaminobacter sp. JC074]
MSNEVLKASVRNEVGKNPVKQVRKAHFIPGVLYGHHIDNVHIKIDEHDFDKFYKRHGIGASLDLEIDGKKSFVLLKDVQYNSLKNLTYHVEFQALAKGEKIKVKVPVHYLNKDQVPAGFIFQELHHEIEVQVLPKDLIEYVEVDLANATTDTTVTVADVETLKSDAYEILDQPDTLLFTISESKVHLEQEPDLEVTPAEEVPEVGEEE